MNKQKLSQLPQLFRGPFLRKVGSGDYYAELSERLQSAGLTRFLELPLHQIFTSVYDILLERYRCEYVYKNALAAEWLSHRHDHAPGFATDEFRVGQNRVDFAVCGRRTMAFEIKSEYDSPTRLPSQTSEYTKVFDLVYVVTCPAMQEKVECAIPKTVGVMHLMRSGELRMIRESQKHALQMDRNIAFDCLRQAEMIAIVEQITGKRLDEPSSRIYTECKAKFKSLLPFEAYQLVKEQLRKRKTPNATEALLDSVPMALKHSAMTLRASKQEIERIEMEMKSVPTRPITRTLHHNAHLLSTPARETERVACA